MSKPTIISECKEPWIYWWRLCTPFEWRERKMKYFPTKDLINSLTAEDIKLIWEGEGSIQLLEEQWLHLAERILMGYNYPPEAKEEIWCQVYRVASARI